MEIVRMIIGMLLIGCGICSPNIFDNIYCIIIFAIVMSGLGMFIFYYGTESDSYMDQG